jgi:hypothetical protein
MSLSSSDLLCLAEIQTRVRDQALSVRARGWTGVRPIAFTVADLEALDTAIEEVLTSRRGRAHITPSGRSALHTGDDTCSP